MLHKYILNHSLGRTTTGSILTGFSGQAATILSGIIVARALGVEGRGYLALLVIFPSILALIGSLGIPHAMTYYIARNHSLTGEMTKVVFRLFPMQVILLVAIHGIVLVFYLADKPSLIKLVGYSTLALIPGILAQQYGLALLQGQNRFKVFNIIRLLLPVFYAALVAIVYISSKANILIVSLCWVAVNVIVGALAIWLGLHSVEAMTTSIHETPTFKELLRFGLSGLLGSVTPMETFRLDQLLAGLFLSPAALGLYVVGQAFTNIPRFIARNAGMVAYPAIAVRRAVAGGDGQKSSERLMRKYFWGITLLNVLLGVLLFAAMPILIPLLFGGDFVHSVPIAQILIIGTVCAASRRILSESLRGLGLPQYSTLAELSMYPWLLSGGAALMCLYDVVGLASAVSIGYVLSLAVSLIMWKNQKHKLLRGEQPRNDFHSARSFSAVKRD